MEQPLDHPLQCPSLLHSPHDPPSVGPTGFFMRIARSLTSVCLFVCLLGCLFCCLFLAIAFISAKCSSLCASSERISAAHTLVAIEIFIHMCKMLFMRQNCEEKSTEKLSQKRAQRTFNWLCAERWEWRGCGGLSKQLRSKYEMLGFNLRETDTKAFGAKSPC